ncbi:MAG: hypothetical protein R3F60_14820 [bacterium]
MDHLSTALKPIMNRLRERFPKMDAAELDRRARLYLAFPKGTRVAAAERFGISPSFLSQVVQGRTRAGWPVAVAIVSAHPGLLALDDVLSPVPLPASVRLRSRDLPAVKAAA